MNKAGENKASAQRRAAVPTDPHTGVRAPGTGESQAQDERTRDKGEGGKWGAGGSPSRRHAEGPARARLKLWWGKEGANEKSPKLSYMLIHGKSLRVFYTQEALSSLLFQF